MNASFKAFAEDLDNVEVCRICINPDGEFYVQNERDGRISRVSSERHRLREFLLAFCQRLECPEHAADPKPVPVRKARSA
jgi:hypothetical protein